MREISEISKRIIDKKIDKKILEKLRNIFFESIRKSDIKQCTFDEDGSLRCSSPEWIICQELFLSMLQGELRMSFILNTPKDLKGYPISFGRPDTKR